MASKRKLERILSAALRFDHPRLDLEQYPTPPEIAASVIHLADLRGDLAGRTIVDLGTGPGILAIASAFREPARVVGIELDPTALGIAVRNERALNPPMSIEWVRGDATRVPVCGSAATALMNPPFGAQAGHEHIDRAFLSAASGIARVTYSFHNAGSRDFIAAFAADGGGTVTDEVAVRMDLAWQFSFHTHERREIEAELYRIEWSH